MDDDRRWRRGDFLALIGLALFSLAFFHESLFTAAPRCLGNPAGDGRTQFFCWRVYGFSRLARGEFPLWNPYVMLGMPFVANLQSAMFYPTNYLCLLLPYAQAINWGIVINLLMGGIFAYALARELGMGWPGGAVTALSFMFGAPQFLRIYEGHWVHLCAIPWIPALFLCVEKLLRSGRAKYALWGGLALAMQLFAGHPQYVFYTSIALCLYFVIRLFSKSRKEMDRVTVVAEDHAHPEGNHRDSPRPLPPGLKTWGRWGYLRCVGLFISLYALGALLSSVQMLPALELLRLSSRGERLPYSWIAQYSLPPENLLTLLVPDLFGVGPGVPYWGRFNVWEMSVYMGIIGFATILVALVFARRREVHIFAAVGVACIVLALGHYTPLLRVLHTYLPGFDLFRASARFLAPASLCLAVLAGFGMQILTESSRADEMDGGNERRRDAALLTLAVLGGILGLAAVGTLLAGERMPRWWVQFFNWAISLGARPYLSPAQVTRELAQNAYLVAAQSVQRSALLVLVFWFCLFAGRFMRRWPRLRYAWVGGIALLLVCADFIAFGQRYLVTFDTKKWAWPHDVVAFLLREQPARVVAPATWAVGPCDGMMYGIACLEGIEPNVPREFRDIFHLSQGLPTDAQRSNYRVRQVTPLLDLLNVKYIIASGPIEGANVRLVLRSDGIYLYEKLHALPRAFLVQDFVVVSGRENTLSVLQSSEIFRHTAVLASANEARGLALFRMEHPDSPEGHVMFQEYSPERIVLRVESPRASILILSDIYYPGWRARVDGRPISIRRADHLLRAVPIEAGAHTVEFVYSPNSFRYGAWVSAGTATSMFLLSICLVLKNRFRRKGCPAR